MIADILGVFRARIFCVLLLAFLKDRDSEMKCFYDVSKKGGLVLPSDTGFDLLF